VVCPELNDTVEVVVVSEIVVVPPTVGVTVVIELSERPRESRKLEI
jgi:hypothetical protein